MVKALFSRRYIFITLLVIAAMAVMARLGVWQLERREQRIARNADLVAKLEAAPLSLNEAALAPAWPLPDDRNAVRNLRAEAAGQYDFAHQMLLVQQNYDGMPGAHLVTPLVLDGGQQAVLVDRGWVPFEDVESGRWQQYDDASGSVTIAGRVQPSQILFGRAAEQAASGAGSHQSEAEWFRIDIEAIQGQVPYHLLPVYLLEAPGPQGNAALPYRIEPDVDLSEGPHLGYALQWFAFAIVAGVVYVAAVNSRLRKAQAAEEQPEAAMPTDTAAGATLDALSVSA
ncbi:MAG TPA: SURF1 family protein [Anaerolineae bacterium]|nr:SURF1 family protein [Anaerolineae bacterium]